MINYNCSSYQQIGLDNNYTQASPYSHNNHMHVCMSQYILYRRVKPTELVSGKKMCEKVFQHAIAKITIPARTREQQQRVVGEFTCV